MRAPALLRIDRQQLDRFQILNTGNVEDAGCDVGGELAEDTSCGASDHGGAPRQNFAVEYELVAESLERVTIRRTGVRPTQVFEFRRCGEIAGEELVTIGAGDDDASTYAGNDHLRSLSDQRHDGFRWLIQLARDAHGIFGVEEARVVTRTGAVERVDCENHSCFCGT